MNFVALIGIVESVRSNSNDLNATINIKVEKPNIDNKDDDWYELVPVFVDKETFKKEIKEVKKGTIVGVKGRLVFCKDNLSSLVVITERFQLF